MPTYKRYIWLKKIGRSDPRVGCSRVCERGTGGHAALTPPTGAIERAALALWAMPAHASSCSSTASTTTDDNLAVYDDAAGLRCSEHQASATSLEVMDTDFGLKGTLSDMH